MSLSPKKTSDKKSLYKEKSFLLLLPIFFVIVILPLIVRYYSYDPKLEIFPWFSSQTIEDDFFLYWKQQFFVAAALVMLILLLIQICVLKKKVSFEKIFIPLLVYAILAFLSTVFSKYSSFGFLGSFQQFENVWCLLGYVLITYYIYLIIDTSKAVKTVLNAFLISAIMMSLLGIGQALGFDFWNTPIGKILIFPFEYWSYDVEAVFGEKRVYLSLYNPNYVGVYVAMLLPVFSVLLFFNRKIKKGVIYVFIIVGLLVSIFGSQSKAGFIGIAVTALLLIIFLRNILVRRWYIILGGFLLLTIIFFGVNYVNDNSYTAALKQAFTFKKTPKPALSDIKTLDDYLEITYNNNIMRIDYGIDENIELSVTDEKGRSIVCEADEQNEILTVKDQRFPGFQIRPVNINKILAIEVTIDNKPWYFAKGIYKEDPSYYYYNVYGKFDKIISHTPAIFTGYESIATNRGFIWSHTIPLLKDYILLGAGANAFTMVYPQQDYVNLYNYGYQEQLLTKPHNLYLQIGVQTGVISLIAFLVVYVIYLISCFKLYFKSKFDSFLSQAGIAIMGGTFGYMVMGFTNDSSITVAPIFWTLLGLGISVNAMAKRSKTLDC